MVPLNLTMSHQGQLQLQHDKGRIIYENMGMMEKALKNQVIESTKDTYLKEFKKKYTSFLGVMCHDLLEHLLNEYRKSTTAYLKTNNQ